MSRPTPKDRRGTWPQALASLAGAILFILAIRWAIFEPYVIPSGSMIPTLLVHDHILVNKFAYGVHLPFSTSWLFRFAGPQRGDVIVFRSLDDESVFIVKRVIGVPGDRIRVVGQGQLEINGKLVPRRTLSAQEIDALLAKWPAEERDDFRARFEFFEEILGGHTHLVLREHDQPEVEQGPFEIGQNEVFMMGDNRDNSSDSRIWGALPVERVLGRAVAIWMSCEETLPDASQMCDPQTMRWHRMFKGIEGAKVP